MDHYTRTTRAWLDQRYRNGPDAYFAHEPIYGLGRGPSEPGHARRVVRLFQLLRTVRQAGGRRLLDMGGAEGYFAFLCRELFGMEVMVADLSGEACRRAAELFGIAGIAADAARLPFATGTFDVVTCAEVAEHLAQPVPAILELQRVAKHAVILATEEWLPTESDRDRCLAERSLHVHGERSIYADCDAGPLFAPATIRIERQLVANLDRFPDDALDLDALRSYLLAMPQAPAAPDQPINGVILTALASGASAPLNRRPTDNEIVDLLLRHALPRHRIPERTSAVPLPTWCELRCPSASGPMRSTANDTWTCPSCAGSFARENGVFELFCAGAPETDPVAAALQRRGNAQPGQLAALQALANKLSFQSLSATTEWDLGTDDGRRDWECQQVRHDGDGCFQAFGPAPTLTSPWVGVPMAQVLGLDVGLSVSGAGDGTTTEARLFVVLSGMSDFEPDVVVRFPVVADGQLRNYRVETPSHLRDTGQVLLRLRLQPTAMPCSFRVGRIAIATAEQAHFARP